MNWNSYPVRRQLRLIGSVAKIPIGCKERLSTPRSRSFCVEVMGEDCHNFGEGAWPNPEGLFNDASFATNVAG